MSILSWLGFGGSGARERPASENETIRQIVEALDAMPREQARWVAAFSYVLCRVAYADRETSSEELAEARFLVREFGGLDSDDADLVVAMAQERAEIFGGTEDFLVTQELATIANDEQRGYLLHCLFAIAAADDSISNVEEREIRQISKELGFSEQEYIHVRAEYHDKREVVKMARS